MMLLKPREDNFSKNFAYGIAQGVLLDFMMIELYDSQELRYNNKAEQMLVLEFRQSWGQW